MIRTIFFGATAGALLLMSSVCPASLAAQQAPSTRQQQAQPQTEGRTQVINGIAAVVNGDVITYTQVRDLSEPREKLLRAQFTGEELQKKVAEARKAVLQDLIDRQLIIQAFNKESFQIPDHYIDQRMEEVIKESFGGDRNTFLKTLQAQNYTMSDFKKLEKEKMIVQAMRGKNVKRTTVISPTKVDEYYGKHREEFSSKEEVKLRLIMIPGHSGDGAAAQKAMAEEILSKLVAGAPFDRMAQMYSEDSTRDAGGDWGWVERKTLAPQLEKPIFNVPKGKISSIIELAGNYYIAKVEDKRGGVTKPLSQVREDIEKKLMQEEAQHQQELWLLSLRQKAYIRTF